jgi:predicted transcriptional regulator
MALASIETDGPGPPPLHELEGAVMEEIRRRDESSVRDVLEALNSRGGTDRACTTYMTIMSRLDSKGS